MTKAARSAETTARMRVAMVAEFYPRICPRSGKLGASPSSAADCTGLSLASAVSKHATLRTDELPCTGVQVPTLRRRLHMVSFFSLGPYSNVRVELTAITPTGPYRLEVDHP